MFKVSIIWYGGTELTMNIMKKLRLNVNVKIACGRHKSSKNNYNKEKYKIASEGSSCVQITKQNLKKVIKKL
jgi:cell division ATPase FtsA